MSTESITRSQALKRFGITDKDFKASTHGIKFEYSWSDVQQLIVNKYRLDDLSQIPMIEDRRKLVKQQRKNDKQEKIRRILADEEDQAKTQLGNLLAEQQIFLSWEELSSFKLNCYSDLISICNNYCKRKFLREHSKFPEALQIADEFIRFADSTETDIQTYLTESRYKIFVSLPNDWRRYRSERERLAQFVLKIILNYKLPSRWPWIN